MSKYIVKQNRTQDAMTVMTSFGLALILMPVLNMYPLN